VRGQDTTVGKEFASVVEDDDPVAQRCPSLSEGADDDLGGVTV
jgi:hypothetical protein